MARQNQISRRHLLWLAVAILVGLMLAMVTTSAMARSASPTSPMQVTGHIRGSVRTPDNMPVDGGWIHMRGEAGQPERGAPIVAGGNFSITDLLPGPYVLIAHPPEDSPYAASVPMGVQIFSAQWTSKTVYLTEVRISGWVQDRDTHARIGGASVVAHDIAWTVERWDVTNITGEFKIGGVMTGVTYILDAVPPPESAYIPPLPYPLVPPTTGVRLEMHVPPTSVIGLVRRPDSTSVPGAGVVVFREGFWLETHTDGLGHFLFRGLPPGEFWIQAAPPWGPDGRGLAASKPFTIVVPFSTPPPLDVVITLPYAPKTLDGQVVLAGTSNGVPGALVRAHRLDEPGYADGPTDPDGRFILSLPGGEWHVDVQPLSPPAPWIFPGPPAWVVFLPPPTTPETKTVTLEVLPTNARVTGRVICPDYDVVHDIPCPSGPPHDAMWVELRNDAIHNSAWLGPDYRFEIPVPDGWYELVVHLNHPGLQAPPSFPIYVPPNQTLPLLDDIRLLPKDAHIVGRVVHDESGQGIPGVPVFGWQPQGFGQGQAETDANGFYDMRVIGGEWFVEPRPEPERPYVFRQPLRLVRVGPGGMVAGVDLGLTYAGARIEGMAVDAHTTAPLWGLDGWAWARLFPSNDLFSDAPLRDGSFRLKVQGDAQYKVGLDLPPHAPYVSGSAGPISVTPAASVFMTVPLEHKNAGIEGHLIVAGTMTPALGVRGEVFGEDGQGHWVVASVNPMSATYGLGLISGTWHLRAWVDPASGYVAVPTPISVTVLANMVVPRDFEVWPINATISGQVLPPAGVVTPVQAFVFAEGNSPFVGHFEAHTWSDPSGHFVLHVPEGGYRVGAGLPDDKLRALGWLNPRPLDFPHVSVANPVTGAMLRFRQWDGDIHGTITFAPAIVVTPTHPAYVRGWSDTGEWAETQATEVTGTSAFTYSLRVISDTVWHVGAIYEDPANGVFYESPEAVVPVLPPTGQVVLDLVLGGPITLPHPFIVSFDASQMQTIIMPDGVELSIPPGALAVSGTVTLFILPTQEMRPEPGHEIIGAGYEIRAVDQNGQQVTQFNQNVAMTLHYSEADLAMRHISEYMLIPVYYSTLAGQWIPADSYVVDTVHNEITLQLSHFTKFSIMSTREAVRTVYLPLVLKNFR